MPFAEPDTRPVPGNRIAHRCAFAGGVRRADLVLVGVSRTSKTPLSVFLAHKGGSTKVQVVLLESLRSDHAQCDGRVAGNYRQSVVGSP